MRRRSPPRPGFATLTVALAAAAMLLGALLWFAPFLTRSQTFRSSVATPLALTAASPFAIPAGERACMFSVAVEPGSAAAQFQLEPGKAGGLIGSPLELVLEGAGYRSASELAGGHRGGIVTLAVTPPAHSLLATACFVNKGVEPVVLAGTTEARTISRSGTTIAGAPVVGDISLTFLERRPRSLLGSLGTVFAHASNLTDHLIPVWLVWAVAVLCAFGVPAGILAAFRWALSEDETALGSR